MDAFTKPGDVVEFTVLKSQPDSDKALELLQKIHSKVKPIMKVHGWVLPVLAEFFPKNPNLLGININRGQKICLRLRPAHDPHSFLPLEEELIGTMLHELTHNHRGPHDEIFNKFLDSLWTEYDSLSRTGYTGEGFLGSGRRVGEGVSHDGGLTMREAREKALKSFEEKERVRKVLGKGGRLGGREVETRGRRMGDVLADAAERRLKALKGCGGQDGEDAQHDHTSGSSQKDLPKEVQEEIERAEKDSRRVVIDLTQEDSDDEKEEEFGSEEFKSTKGKRKANMEKNEEEDRKPDLTREESPDLIIVSSTSTSTTSQQPTKKKRPAPSSPPSSSSNRRPPPSTSTSSLSASTSQVSSEGWACELCTYFNPSSLHLSCSICLAERPSVASSSSSATTSTSSTMPSTMTLKSITGTKKQVVMRPSDEFWYCGYCGKEMEKMFWTCGDCGRMKESS
ncbi:uncharacterized protein JCM6883_000628 [Sporobolomyces salmoneus]|uniref:uncharacterized protein n=1 Tax=Sporobolomyces salmoneus TaxID=183962 RepID=UPI00316F55C2